MSTDFDVKKALAEEINGLLIVKKDIQHLVRSAQQKLGEAELQLNAAKSTEGYLQIELERKQNILRQIIAQEKANETQS
jgi:hypothetical protein